MNKDYKSGEETSDVCSICLERALNVILYSIASLKSTVVCTSFALSASTSGPRYFCFYLQKKVTCPICRKQFAKIMTKRKVV